MASKSSPMRFWRSVHLYFGLFISPAMLFFALTGIAQTLSLHEAAGSSYKPPAWLATLGQIHKKQTWKVPARREGGPQAPPATTGGPAPLAGDAPARQYADRDHDRPHPHGTQAADRPSTSAPADTRGASGTGQPVSLQAALPSQPRTLADKERQHLPLKIFFILASLGLLISTTTGIYMAYVYRNNRLWVTAALLAGIALPLILLPF